MLGNQTTAMSRPSNQYTKIASTHRTEVGTMQYKTTVNIKDTVKIHTTAESFQSTKTLFDNHKGTLISHNSKIVINVPLFSLGM